MVCDDNYVTGVISSFVTFLFSSPRFSSVLLSSIIFTHHLLPLLSQVPGVDKYPPSLAPRVTIVRPEPVSPRSTLASPDPGPTGPTWPRKLSALNVPDSTTAPVARQPRMISVHPDIIVLRVSREDVLEGILLLLFLLLLL